MSNTMKAAVLHATHDLRLDEVERPVIKGPTDLLIEVTYNGLCGTDATEFTKGPMMVPLHTQHPNSKHVGATILGHEFIGTVVESGVDAKEMLGMRVACGAGVSCGSCRMCRQGRTNLCDHYYTLGLSDHGGLAQFVVAPKSICIPIPDDCSNESAALAQPLAVGIHAVRRAKIRTGDRVILLGVGAIGSFVCVGLQKSGARVIVMDIDQKRLNTALELGAHEAILIAPDATPADLKKHFPSGVEVVFETSGAPGAATRALALTKMGGTLLLLGLNKTPQVFPFADAVLREVTLETTVAHVCGQDIPEALEMLQSGKVAKLLTGQIFALDKINEAMEILSTGKATGKILIAVK